MAALDFSRAANAANPLARISSILTSVSGSFVRWNQARQTRNALTALTDRELEDIGLVRGDIESVIN